MCEGSPLRLDGSSTCAGFTAMPDGNFVLSKAHAYKSNRIPQIRLSSTPSYLDLDSIVFGSKYDGAEGKIIYIGFEIIVFGQILAGRPGSSEVPRNPLTRWDVSSIPANGIFLAKNLKKKKKKCPTGGERLKSLVHKIRLHGRRGKGMAESLSREKFRHAPQKEGG